METDKLRTGLANISSLAITYIVNDVARLYNAEFSTVTGQLMSARAHTAAIAC